MKRKLILLALAAVMVGALIAVWSLYPVPVKRGIIVATSTTKWAEYERLTKLLSLGMEPAQVERILGKPSLAETLSVGQRWAYMEDGPTAGWTCVVEFKREEPAQLLKLCYVLNIQHVVFRDSPRSEIGQKLNLKEPEGTIMLGLSNRSSKASGTNN